MILKLIIIKTKKCNKCGRTLPISKFSENKNNKDKLSYYCKDCTKQQKNLYFYNQGNAYYEKVIIDELNKYDDIKIDGIDYDKILATKITLIDFPGIFNNLLYDLPIFLRKYDLSFEEYKFIIQQCKDNKLWIESKDLNS